MIDQFPGNGERGTPKPDFRINVTPAGKNKARRIDVGYIAAYAPADLYGMEAPEDAQARIWISDVPVNELQEDDETDHFEMITIKETPEQLTRMLNCTPDDAFITQTRGSIIHDRQQAAEARIREIEGQIREQEREQEAGYRTVFDQHNTPKTIADRTALETKSRINQSYWGQFLFYIHDSIHTPMADDGSRRKQSMSGLFGWVKPVIWWASKESEIGQEIKSWQRNSSKAHQHEVAISTALATRNRNVEAFKQSVGMDLRSARRDKQMQTALRSDDEQLRTAILDVMRRKADPDFYVFAPDENGVYFNMVGDVDPLTHQPYQKRRSPFAVGRIRKPWSIF